MKKWKFCWILMLAAVAGASIIGWRDVQAQDIYVRNWPDAVPAVEYGAWAWNNRIGTRAELAGTTHEFCKPAGTITIGKASTAAEWESHNQGPNVSAITYTCFGGWESFGILFRHDTDLPTYSLMTHEIGHALGCWDHVAVGAHWVEHVMATLVNSWAALTVQDVGCASEAHFPTYAPPDVCWTELTPRFDLIAPAAMGMYARLKFVGNVETQDYRWQQVAWHDSNGPDCTTVRDLGWGVVQMDDVRSQGWQGTAQIQGNGSEWELIMAVPK